MEEYRREDVHECPVCGGCTNLQVTTANWGADVIMCPNAEECWHHEIDARLRWLAFPHPQSVREEIEKEVAELRGAHANDVRHDVVRAVDEKPCVSSIIKTFTRPIDGECLHHTRGLRGGGELILRDPRNHGLG